MLKKRRSEEVKNKLIPRKADPNSRMITRRSFLLLTVGLMVFACPALARQDAYLPKADIPGEELYNALADEVQKMHNEELKLIGYLQRMATRHEHEEELIQQELHKQQQQQQQQQTGDDSLLDDLPAENPVKTLSKLSRLQELPKPLAYQKPREEKKSNHYMSLCHFKLCNMGRKRNTRYLSFWN